MDSKTQLRSAVRLALWSSAAGTALVGTAVAQEARFEEIVVTGTRIVTPGLTANSPIATVDAAEIDFTQPVAIEELIRTLPWAAPAIGPGVNNGTGGGATIDMRGLGPNRTLVLIDGRRVVPFDLEGRVDTNTIPVALLERVDLVTGGASAVYGADAVTGVVNFLLRRDFEGIDLSASYGISGESDTERYRADMTIGGNLDDGRGNVALSVGYTEAKPLLQGDRSFGQDSLSSATGAAQGSPTAIPVTSLAPNFGFPSGAAQIDPDTGEFVDLFSTYNFNPQNYYITPLERYQATALGHYSITDRIEGYGHLFYTRSNVDAQLASSGTFFNVYQLPIGNPYLPEPARQQLCAQVENLAGPCAVGNAEDEIVMALGRRITELGPRLNNHETTMFQYNVGVRGEITNNWSFDAYWSHGESNQSQTRSNWGSYSKVQQALRVNPNDPTQCLDPSNGCVPLDLFGLEGSITPEMVAFINQDALLRQEVDQDVLAGFITGSVGQNVMASNYPVGLAFGVEYRELAAANKSDAASQIQNEVLGTGAPTPDRAGKFDLKEIYAETLVPLISDRPLAHALTLEAGYRWTEFSTDSSQTYGSWKFGGEWAPTEGLRFRAMRQRATRAPNVDELFQPPVSGLSNLDTDPCQGNAINPAEANTPGTLSNLCRETGVPLQQIGTLSAPSAGQINVLLAGNPELGPEKADTTTVGFVWQPRFADGLILTLDYYRIKLNDAISEPSETDILVDCYDPSRNPGLTFNAACAQVLRSPVTGTFNGADAPGVQLPTSNLGFMETDGFDLGVHYRFDFTSPRWGSLELGFMANKVESAVFQATPGSVRRECMGFYSVACGATGPDAAPEWKWTQRTTWTTGNFDVSLQWRHISGMDEEPGGTDFLPAFASISSYNLYDLSAAWQATDAIRLNLVVRNLLDEKPPIIGNTIGTTSFNSGNTFPQFYDVIGRYFTVAASMRF
jgi:iron complex outermembrane recepter protein